MQNIMQQKEKTKIIVGFEPTGHYWFTLGDYLKSKGHTLGI
jgi:transposase